MTTGKKVKDSQVTMTEIVLPSHTNQLGTIFGGQIMAWIDIAAAIAATRHAKKICVTVSIDTLHFIAPAKLGDAVNLCASVNYNHNTSMEVGVRVESENVLSDKNVFSTKGMGGKRAIRVYPPWESNLNRQAQKTQEWQTKYFLDMTLTTNIDYERCRKLYSLT